MTLLVDKELATSYSSVITYTHECITTHHLTVSPELIKTVEDPEQSFLILDPTHSLPKQKEQECSHLLCQSLNHELNQRINVLYVSFRNDWKDKSKKIRHDHTTLLIIGLVCSIPIGITGSAMALTCELPITNDNFKFMAQSVALIMFPVITIAALLPGVLVKPPKPTYAFGCHCIPSKKRQRSTQARLTCRGFYGFSDNKDFAHSNLPNVKIPQYKHLILSDENSGQYQLSAAQNLSKPKFRVSFEQETNSKASSASSL